MSLEVEKRFRELERELYSPAQIYEKLESEFGEGSPGMVSDRTIRQYVKARRPPDPSEPWSLADDSEEAAFLLLVLGAIMLSSEGRISHLTGKQAEWLGRIKDAVPDIPPLTAFWFTRAYMLCENKGQDTAHLDMGLALTPTAADALPELALDAVKARIGLHIDLHLRLWPGRPLMVWPRAVWIKEEYVETAKSRGAQMFVHLGGSLGSGLEIWFEGGVQ
jgi:hypothetical protein